MPAPSVAQILKLHDAAVHKAPGASAATTLEVRGTLAGQGLTGTFHSWHDGAKSRSDQAFGPRSESTLRLGERIVYSDGNGDVRTFRGVYLRRERTAAFIDSGDFIDHPQAVRYMGAKTINGAPTYALEVKAPQGEPQHLYIDQATYLIDRLEYEAGDGLETIDFSDYREVEGEMFAFHGVASNGDHEFDIIENTTEISFGKPIGSEVFLVPAQRFIDIAAPVEVPLIERADHLYASVSIGGKAYQFLVDTGAQNIVVDTSVAREAHLAEVGTLQVAGATRTGGLKLAKVSELMVGAAKLHDLVVSTIDLGSSTQGVFRIDGILGYPFFAGAVVRIDPVAKKMTLSRPGSAELTGTRVEIAMDRAFPEVSAVLNAGLRAPFILDTGNGAEVLLYRPFVDAHAGIVKISFDGRTTYGVGGAAQTYRTMLGSIEFGGFTFFNRRTNVMLGDRGAFADRFDAGNIGLGVLKNFILTFDAYNSALYLEKVPGFEDGRDRPSR